MVIVVEGIKYYNRCKETSENIAVVTLVKILEDMVNRGNLVQSMMW